MSNRLGHGGQILIVVACVGLIEKLSSHHHLLLRIHVLVRCFPLVYQVEKVSLVIRCRSVCSSDPLVADATGIGGETGRCVSLTAENLVLVESVAACLSGVSVLASVALSQFRHEITVEHSLAHLLLLLCLRQLLLVLASPCIEASHSSLIEHLLLIQLVHVWKHLVDSRIIRGLQHNARLCRIHLIDAQRPVARIVCATLLPHPVCHEESLIWFLGSQPAKEKMKKISLLTFRSFFELATSFKRLCNFSCFDV